MCEDAGAGPSRQSPSCALSERLGEAQLTSCTSDDESGGQGNDIDPCEDATGQRIASDDRKSCDNQDAEDRAEPQDDP